MTTYIATNSTILGGKPVIAGTRIPIARILFLLKEGYTIETIQEEYPYVEKKRIEGAISELIDRLDANVPQIL